MGTGSSGQLGGAGGGTTAYSPMQIDQSAAPAGATFKSVSMSDQYHGCAIASDNKAYCWGYSVYGQIGNGSTGYVLTPAAVSQGAMPAGVTFKAISAGNYHTCAIGSNDLLYCWGNNSYGQLGDNTTAQKNTPVATLQGDIPAGITIKQVSTGTYFTCAIASNNLAYCWGQNNTYGKLGIGVPSNRAVPAQVTLPSGVTGFKYISAGYDTACAISTTDTAYCWGYNANGQLGNGNTTSQTIPVAVAQGAIPAGATILSINVGRYHTCAVASDNKAYCWGAGTSGALGQGSTGSSSVPTAVLQGTMPANAVVKSVNAANDNYTVAVTSDGRAYWWGKLTIYGFGASNTSPIDFPSPFITKNVVGSSGASNNSYRLY
jgi:alpha-tubulin suppressor-like RCC1 family protein